MPVSHHLRLTILLLAAVAGCQEPPADRDAVPAAPTDTTPAVEDRPPHRTDTVRLEGMPETLSLRLFQAPGSFPLPFSAYVPEQLAAETVSEANIQFVAEFGGHRNEDAFLHVHVLPPGTSQEAAVAEARAYKTGRGVPVSQGIEIVQDEQTPPDLPWALEAFPFRYQSGGEWFTGRIAVGRHGGLFFMIVRHYPAEYGDGFGPRADLILDSWRWEDGSGLNAR